MQQCCCDCCDCPLRIPLPPECKPCSGIRNAVCSSDKQPKLVGSLLGYFCINREPKNDFGGDVDVGGSSGSCCFNAISDNDQYKGWTGRHLYNACREQRNYTLRFTSSGVHGRGFNNTYRACSKGDCGNGSCSGSDCDLYTPRLNDRY